MIGRLRGTIEAIFPDTAIIDVQGVGYVVSGSSKMLSALPDIGQPVVVLVETMVGEDFIRLYGFNDLLERDWFRLLLSVQGVGARLALAILGCLTHTELTDAIILQDKVTLLQVSGVGPRLASRILVELKDKVSKLESKAIAHENKITNNNAHIADASHHNKIRQEAQSALMNLGYSGPDVTQALTRLQRDADNNQTMNLQTLIKLGLKALNT